MTDYDIQRCKRFKYFSTGSAVFYLVVIAAYIAMLSESLIEQFMDVSISSVWLGFLLFNNKMFTISPAIIVAIYGSILAFTAYRLLVFVPAVKRARAARASKRRAAQEFQRLRPAHNRPRRGAVRSCSVLYSKLVINVGHFMDLFTDSDKESRALHERTSNEMWTSMNKRAKSDTSAVPSPPASVSSHSAVSATDSGRFSNLVNTTAQNNSNYREQLIKRRSAFRLSTLVVNPEVNIPPMILAMRGTGTSFIASCEADQTAAKQFFGCEEARPSSPTPKLSYPTDLPIVYAASSRGRGIGMRAKSFRATKGITADANVALQRLLDRHFLGPNAAERGDTISTFEEAESLKCTFYLSELESHMTFILDIYYPNDIILSEDEREEVFQQFHLWWEASRSTVPAEDLEQRNRVSFSAFSSWFLLLSEALITAHTTRPELEQEPEIEIIEEEIPELIAYPTPIVSDRWEGMGLNFFI